MDLSMDLHQGDCIRLGGDAADDEQLYQVISVDRGHDRCWLRRWPLARRGSPVFEVSLGQLHGVRGACRPLPHPPAP
jgi:hypothetical protein